LETKSVDAIHAIVKGFEHGASRGIAFATVHRRARPPRCCTCSRRVMDQNEAINCPKRSATFELWREQLKHLLLGRKARRGG
jgi:hypothetical protein